MNTPLQWEESLGEFPKYEERSQFLLSVGSDAMINKKQRLNQPIASTSVKNSRINKPTRSSVTFLRILPL